MAPDHPEFRGLLIPRDNDIIRWIPMTHQNYDDFASRSAGSLNFLLDMQRKNLQALSAVQRLVFDTMQNLTGAQLGLLSQMADRCSFGSEPVNENPPEEEEAQPEAKEQRKKAA